MGTMQYSLTFTFLKDNKACSTKYIHISQKNIIVLLFSTTV